MFVPYVLVLLLQDNKVLLLQRGNVSFGSGLYCLPGGKIDGNETARQAAIREAHEELGITIAENDLAFAHIFHRKSPTEEIFAIIFAVTRWQGECFNKEPHKHTQLAWFPLDNLPTTMIPAHKQALEYIAHNIPYSEHGWK